ncbi:MAG: RHS repeat domain-containing protein, partial [Marinicella sp.]
DITDTSISRNAFEYDEWGNIIKVTSSGKTSNLPIGETQNRITKSEFRGTGGYFANQIIKELGIQEYTTYIKYDNATGQVLSTTNPSGVKTVNDYDEFGFPKSAHTFVAVDPNDQLEAPSGAAMKNCGLGCSSQKALLNNLINAIKPHIPSNTGFFFQSNSSIPEITFKADNKQSGSPRVTTWLDQNGNAVLTKTQHSGGQAYVLTLTNPLGQVELITEPFAVSGNNYLNDYSDPNITRDYPYFTFNLYDERGRMREKLVEVGQLNGDGDNCKRNTVYEHFRNNTKVTAGFSGDNCQSVDQDNNNLEMYRTYDLQGKIRQTVDAKEFITKYWYDSSGNPHYITDAANNHIITHYDDLSRKTAVQDPNMGTKTFLYNSFGEVVFQRDAVQAEYSGYIANYSLYDQWGRVTNQYINSQYIGGVFEPVAGIRAYFDSYDYSSGCSTGNNTLCGRFRLSSYNSYTEEDSDGFYAAQEIEYQYDAFGRVISEATEMPGVLGEYGIDNLLTDPSLTTQYYYYENHNLLKQTIHNNIRGNGLSVVNHYDAYGSLTKQVENPSGNELMRVVDWDLRGQPLAKVLNDNSNMMTEYSYYPGSGQTKSINNSHSGGLQSFDYSYDAWGNIYSQKLNNNIIETFKYDELQRLKESKIGHAAISFEYDDTIGLGNLISKSDYSMNQVYDQNGKPNAIISAALNSGGVLHYEYDFNGNRIKDSLTGSPDSGIKANYQYDAANLLIASQRPAESQYVSYRYGIGNQRFAKHEETYDEHGVARGEITLYVGSQFEQVINTITHEIETKFQLTDYLTITLDNLSNQVRNFTQKDRLGSTTQILNASGIQVATKGYDAFGKPRNGDNWSQLIKPTLDFKNPDLTANSIDITKRGFTNHEHLDAFELIHMNGRMYDFNNGRFLSVDPFIQGTTSQAINPYSYIDNNPLSGTDPTGYRKSICGQDGMRKCDTIIGPHSRKGVWNGFANTNGKVIGVIVFTGDNDDTSGIWSLNDRGEFNKENSDYLNGKKLLFFNAIERMMYILAYDSGSLNLLAQSDADARFNPEIAQYVPKRYNPDRDINDLFEMLSVADQAFRGYFENIDQNSLEFAKGYRDGVISVPVSILKLYATLPHIWSDEGIIARRVIDHELNSYILIPEYRKEVNHYINYGIKIAISRMSDEQLSYYAGRYLGRDHTIDLLNRNVSSAPGLGEFYYGIHSAAE